MKVAVITPYYKEPLTQLRQCIQSVRDQSIPCTHILVADGHAKSGIKMTGKMEHVILPKSNKDAGNTPRGIGGILADSWGFDAVCYLDADNWYEPDHVARLIQHHKDTAYPLITCKRRFFTLGEEVMNYSEFHEMQNMHVDTNCWFIARPAFSLLPIWCMPKELGPVGDRVFFQKAKYDKFEIGFTEARTVAYRTAHAIHYIEAGHQPHPSAKGSIDFAVVRRYLLDPANHAALLSKFGFIPSL